MEIALAAITGFFVVLVFFADRRLSTVIDKHTEEIAKIETRVFGLQSRLEHAEESLAKLEQRTMPAHQRNLAAIAGSRGFTAHRNKVEAGLLENSDA
jgi:hypothetical protein